MNDNLKRGPYPRSVTRRGLRVERVNVIAGAPHGGYLVVAGRSDSGAHMQFCEAF